MKYKADKKRLKKLKEAEKLLAKAVSILSKLEGRVDLQSLYTELHHAPDILGEDIENFKFSLERAQEDK